MEVTEVRIFPVQEDRLKAYVAITFDNCFVVRDLKVISGNNGLFVAMPSKKRKDTISPLRKTPLLRFLERGQGGEDLFSLITSKPHPTRL